MFDLIYLTKRVLNLKASSLKYEDYFNSQITRSVAEKLADFHMLKMPVSKEPKWIFNLTEAMLDSSEKIVFKDQDKQRLHETVKSFDLRSEYFKLE